MLARATSSGLMSAVCEVIDLGIVPTPCAEHYVAKAGGTLKGAVVVTASHNPREFNGLKAIDARGMEMRREDEEAIESIFFEERFRVAPWSEVGSIRSDDTAVSRYLEAILGKVDVDAIRKAAFTVVVDPGNGAGCLSTPYLLRSLGCRVISLNGQPDGAFPGRMPEPIPAHVGDLMRLVSEVHANLGVAHDGDADRAVFVDDQGSFVVGDKSLALLARAAIPEYHIKKANVPVPADQRDAVLSSIVALAKGRRVDTTDGVKILEADGAVLVRPSGTEPIFRVYAEGRTSARADALAAEGVDLVKKALHL